MNKVTLAAIFLLTTEALLITHNAEAGERRFTYVYEATTAAKGEIEIENWVTWKTQREEASRGNTFDFRHEIEFGLTDKLQLGVYVADWSV